MKVEFIFKILAVILLGGAAIFLWQQNWDGVFATVVLGICAYFISMRFQLKARVDLIKSQEKGSEDNSE